MWSAAALLTLLGTVSAFTRSSVSSRCQFRLDYSKNSEEDTLSRRGLLQNAIGLTAGAMVAAPGKAFASSDKILVLGGTGLVGSEVVKTLQSKGYTVVATSRDGRDGTVALDLSSPETASTIKELSRDAFAVISCVGAIGTSNDQAVNAGTGVAASAAKAAGVSNFAYITVAPEVVEFGKGFDFLGPYMAGKQSSRATVLSEFGGKATLIEPTFIYGGDKFEINPPRVASGYGKLVENVLSSGPIRAIDGVLGGFPKIALEPPVSATSVAEAAVAGVLGKSSGNIFDTYDKIQAAAKTISQS